MDPARLEGTETATPEASRDGRGAEGNGHGDGFAQDGHEPAALLPPPETEAPFDDVASGVLPQAPPASGPGASPAEPERDWSAWLDGRPRRLKRGRDYTGDPRSVVKRAREAADALGKLAVASRDSQGRYEYLWVQFVDGAVEPGRPCPVCAGTAFEKVQKHFLRCVSCASVLKAANDWEVEAGRFTSSTPAPRTDVMAPPGLGDVARADEEYAEILGARVLSTDGREIEGPLVTEDFVLHLAFRLLRPVDAALPRVRMSVGDAGPSIRLQPPRALGPSGPRTVDVRITIPGNLLMPRVYSVEIVLLLVPDARWPDDYLRITVGDALAFRVRKAPSRSIIDMGEESHPPFRWDLEVRLDAS